MKKYVASVTIALLFGCISFGQNKRLYETGEYGAGEISSNLIHDICQDSKGFIWIATEYGLNKFDGITFKQYLHDENDTSSVSDLWHFPHGIYLTNEMKRKEIRT